MTIRRIPVTPLHVKFLRWFRRHEHIHLPAGLVLFSLSLGFAWGRGVQAVFERLFWALALLYFMCWVLLLLARAAEKYPVRLKRGLKQFLDTPQDLAVEGYAFRIRPVKTVLDAENRMRPDLVDIGAFVRLSEQSATIVSAHLDLDAAQRLRLYERWCTWSPRSFMLLEHKIQSTVNGANKLEVAWDAAAVTIMLPLSKSGKRRLLDGDTEVIDLIETDIQKSEGRTSCLLIDSWVVSKQYQRIPSHNGHVLLLRHLAAFWNRRGRGRMTLFVEPDNRSLHRFLCRAAFNGPLPIGRKSRLYFINLPTDLVTREMREVYDELIERLRTYR
jgi:hypothetical protein